MVFTRLKPNARSRTRLTALVVPFVAIGRVEAAPRMPLREQRIPDADQVENCSTARAISLGVVWQWLKGGYRR